MLGLRSCGTFWTLQRTCRWRRPEVGTLRLASRYGNSLLVPVSFQLFHSTLLCGATITDTSQTLAIHVARQTWSLVATFVIRWCLLFAYRVSLEAASASRYVRRSLWRTLRAVLRYRPLPLPQPSHRPSAAYSSISAVPLDLLEVGRRGSGLRTLLRW